MSMTGSRTGKVADSRIRGRRDAVIDQAHVRGCATHIERDRARKAGLTRHRLRADNARRRAGQYRAHGFRSRKGR
jgi:hypothetical protein